MAIARATSARCCRASGSRSGFTLAYLSLLVLIPLAGAVREVGVARRRASSSAAVGVAARARRLPALLRRLVRGGGCVNAVFGLLVAWVLVRYRFPGRGLVDALVDLPFALPTAVAGITLTALLAKNGWLGRLLEPLGIQVAYTPLGVDRRARPSSACRSWCARVQPVLEDLEAELEEAAASLGASRWQTFRARALPGALAGARHRLRAGLRARASASTARSSSSRATCR